MFERVFRQVFLLALVFVLIARSASAQMTDPRGNSRVHLGPLYATPAVNIQEFGVDTNVFNSPTEQKDFTVTLVPRATVWIPFARRVLLTTGAGADLVYYQKYASERSVNPQVHVRGDASLGRLQPFAEGFYLNTRQRPNYEIDARVRRTEESARLGTAIRVSQKLFFEVAGSQSKVAFGSDATYDDVNLRDVLDRTERVAALSVRHELTPLTTIAVHAEGETDRFQFSPLRDANSVRVMPGVEFQPRALISGSAYVGVRRFTPLSSELASFTGTVASAMLNYTLKTTTRFTFTADRDLTYSYEAVQPYFVVDGYGLTVGRQLVGRTDLTVGAQRQQYAYRDLLLPGALPEDLHRIDLTHIYSATVGYRFGQTARIGFGAAYRQRNSNSLRFRDYQGFRFLTTLDYGL